MTHGEMHALRSIFSCLRRSYEKEKRDSGLPDYVLDTELKAFDDTVYHVVEILLSNKEISFPSRVIVNGERISVEWEDKIILLVDIGLSMTGVDIIPLGSDAVLCRTVTDIGSTKSNKFIKVILEAYAGRGEI